MATPNTESFHRSIKEEYEQQNRLLSFDEYLGLVRADPAAQTRSSAQYMVDMMDHFGRRDGRFRLFDQDFADPRFRLIGHEQVQERIHQILQSFIREGVNNKLILLHGPNGSAKSSIVSCLTRGLEEYSSRAEGAVYRFHWIFPADRFGKPGLGLGGGAGAKDDDLADALMLLMEGSYTARVTLGAAGPARAVARSAKALIKFHLEGC